jgi:hypothetical protein
VVLTCFALQPCEDTDIQPGPYSSNGLDHSLLYAVDIEFSTNELLDETTIMANSNEQHNKRNPPTDSHTTQERSFSSSHLTPQSLPFNFSQQHHQQSQRRRTPGGSSPSSTLLQDLLREKKAQSRRVSKAYNSRRRSGKDDGLFGLDDAEFANRRLVQSSPLGPLCRRDEGRFQGR